MKDDKTISKLYEAIHKVDYFSVDEKEFDEDKFFNVEEDFQNLNALNIYSYILESFKLVKQNSPTNDGNEDVYEVVLHNGQLFTLHLNYVNPNQIKDFVKRKVVSAEMKKLNTMVQDYSNLLKELKDNETFCIIMFRDEQDQLEQTGKVGISAKELFITLKNAILDSWSKRDSKNIKGVIMRVNKSEPKRLEFYKLLLNKFLPEFKNIIIDNVSEPAILLIASR